MKIYLAHPITGLKPDEVFAYYDKLVERLRPFVVLFPMLGKDYFRGQKEAFAPQGYGQALSNNHSIVQRDHWMVSQSDVVLADLTGAKAVSIGCMMEIAWAHHLRKHTLVVMEANNPHEHGFVLECADVIYPNLDEALAYLHQLGLATHRA